MIVVDGHARIPPGEQIAQCAVESFGSGLQEEVGTFLRPRHLALSSPEGLVRDLGPIFLASPLLMISSQANLPERSAIGPKLVGRHSGGSEAVFLEQLTDELVRRGLIPSTLDQDL